MCFWISGVHLRSCLSTLSLIVYMAWQNSGRRFFWSARKFIPLVLNATVVFGCRALSLYKLFWPQGERIMRWPRKLLRAVCKTKGGALSFVFECSCSNRSCVSQVATNVLLFSGLVFATRNTHKLRCETKLLIMLVDRMRRLSCAKKKGERRGVWAAQVTERSDKRARVPANRALVVLTRHCCAQRLTGDNPTT